jgi:NAD(P)-dependent dehydrogenase (short-subunit alcohol dehydrogenase family)
MDFLNQSVAISEAERPIARALADAFAREGANVVRIPPDATPAEFARQHQPIDVLLLVTPALPVGPTLEQTDAAAETMLSRALVRALQLIQALGAVMVERRRGCIVTVAGLMGSTGWPRWAASSALQGALLSLTRSLAVEWAAQNVRLVYLACGAADGEPITASPHGGVPKQAELVARTPMARIAGAEEIAQVALYLASDRASSITGTEIRVDGGWTAWGLLK